VPLQPAARGLGRALRERAEHALRDGRVTVELRRAAVRRTYEHMAANWPQAPDDNPFKRVMMEFRKLVASRTLSEPLEWQNSC